MKTYRLIMLSALVLILVRGLETFAQNNQQVSYGPAVVQLRGRLFVERRYGPPGFGENPKTDARMRVPILVLVHPVSLKGNPDYFPYNVDIKDVKRIQLMLYDLKTPYPQFVGRSIIARGTLVHGHTGIHYTDVVMDVQSIKSQRSKKPWQRKDKNRKELGSGLRFAIPSTFMVIQQGSG